ncbi:TetR/AcrR family transcriptional regulator [Chromobacterium sphagni]|uniref:TetR family transcriptional regulator n=1 Tax=Chromobacterium sphagni TaxID=1903179 RepID=A0A1S1WT91_9NEIS|nr:TetR/AcrR family transcriptional regulator [Chromobacterium sphagni]OHX10423.1 TetR family transcriptional regulator [Chromobacterium sphagni]OHX19136.1 TetR family transcriptional regulator [Chromobacterium sphagni]
MMLTPTPILKEQAARERILLTAHRLFYLEGIRATGIDRIIAESGVTKVTFYRHFPSKNELIHAYLEYRHALWLQWFGDALSRHGGGIGALVPALREWLENEQFRGCAFINGVSELGPVSAETMEIARRHKQALREAIAGLLPDTAEKEERASLLAMAADGAIVRAQMENGAQPALASLGLLIRLLPAPAQG